ncbi:hypothetical protein D3C73_1370630 [compost metagenome]
MVTHVDIGTCQIELGGHFVAAGEEIEVQIVQGFRLLGSICSAEVRLQRRRLEVLRQLVQLGIDVAQLRSKALGGR